MSYATAPFRKPPVVAFLIVVALLGGPAFAGDWPRWRGPNGDGVSPEAEFPQTWSATQNVTWKVPLPGPGNSSPIVLGDRVFVSCASNKGAVRSLICFDRADGKVRWRKDVAYKGEEPTHETNPYDASTPASDGKAVYVWHGSAGFYAYDLDGNELWHRDLGPFSFIWGNASSPVLLNDRVILSAGPGPRSVLLAMNKQTGETIWQNELTDARPRKADEWAGAWATPVIRKTRDGKQELVCSLPDYVAGFDPDTGKESWRCRGLSRLCYADPLIGDGYIVAMSGYGGPAIGLRAPQPGETGDLTDTHRLWVVAQNQQRIGSGQIVNGSVYMLNEPGVMQCIDPKTGIDVWKKRLTGTTWGSLVRAGDLFYATNQSGETIVFRVTPAGPEVLHENALDGDRTNSTTALSDGQIFVKTWKSLYCIGKRKTT